MNMVALTGRVARDPDLCIVGEKGTTTAPIVIDRESGSDQTDFISCQLIGERTKKFVEYNNKGRKIEVHEQQQTWLEGERENIRDRYLVKADHNRSKSRPNNKSRIKAKRKIRSKVREIMKKFTFALIALAMLFSVAPMAAEAAAPPKIIIDGKAFSAPKNEPAPYINKDDRTMIPIRFFAAALGVPNDEAHIAWDADTKTAAIVSEDRAVYITVGKREIVANENIVIMDTVAEIKNSRVFIPARYLAEALGCNVQWDNEGRRVLIYTPKYLENHKAMQTGSKLDIDDPWMTEAFFEKWKKKVDVAPYGSAEVLQQRITEVRQLASNVKIVKDEKNKRYTVTIPEYDQTKYYILLTSPALGTQMDPGVYHVYFKDTHPETRYVYGISISDRRTRAYILYQFAVFDEDGVHKTYNGSDIEKYRERMGL